MLDTKIIGNKIAEARKKINMSQAQLAGLLFISPQAVGKWERGESSPDIVTFNRLAEILGVDLNYFSESFQSRDNETALKTPVDNIHSIERTEHEVTSQEESHLPINLTAVNMQESDFEGTVLHKGKFKDSLLCRADFTDADLTGSLFEVSDVREAKFDGANLTDCTFSITMRASMNPFLYVPISISRHLPEQNLQMWH
ncbi:MAG TPA: helix-turn-helix domain-containing protein [Sphingobacteriaceae bacterium]